MFIVHLFVPFQCIKTVLAPIVTSRNSNISRFANYRPITFASIPNLFQLYILIKTKPLLKTNKSQYGFK